MYIVHMYYTLCTCVQPSSCVHLSKDNLQSISKRTTNYKTWLRIYGLKHVHHVYRTSILHSMCKRVS